MPKYLKGQRGSIGAIPILILLAAVGLLGFLLISNTFGFKDALFARLFPKPSSEAAQVLGESPSVPDEIIFKFKPGVSEDAKNSITNEHALEVLETIPQINVLRVRVTAQAKDQVIEALNHNPNIEYAEPNYILESFLTPTDPNFTNQWGLHNTGQTFNNVKGKVDADIDAPEAWDISTGSSNVIVAVIDTGLFMQHEDIIGKVWVNSDEIPNNGIDDDNNGYIDDVNGWDFSNCADYDSVLNKCVKTKVEDNDPSDPLGHGTAVSGEVGALTNNSKGIAAPPWKSIIMPLKDTEDSAGGTIIGWDMIEAITYAANNAAQVINLSQGGYWDCATQAKATQDAVNYAWNKGLVIVASAGNDPTKSVAGPANCNNVVAAGATDNQDIKASFSSTGAKLDVVAPGWYILSTVKEGGYGYWSGTSMSSPYVAGLAALLFSTKPSLTNQQVVDIIASPNGTDDLGPASFDNEYGWGRINAAKALAAATGQPIPTSAPTPTPAPTVSADTVVISNISSTTTASSATINWTTNIPSSSRVSYGLTTSLGSSTTEDPTLTTNHTVTITGLTPRTRYYFKVHSKNSAGLESTSPTVSQFRTKNR